MRIDNLNCFHWKNPIKESSHLTSLFIEIMTYAQKERIVKNEEIGHICYSALCVIDMWFEKRDLDWSYHKHYTLRNYKLYQGMKTFFN